MHVLMPPAHNTRSAQDTDLLAVISWQWYLSLLSSTTLSLEVVFAGGGQTANYLWPATDVFRLKEAMGLSAVVSCVGELIPLWETEFSDVLNLVRAVHKSDSLRIFINRTHKSDDQSKVTDMVLTGSMCFLCQALSGNKGPPPTLSRSKLYSSLTISIWPRHRTSRVAYIPDDKY